MAPFRLNGPLEGCENAPDCMAWVRSGCNPGLAGRDPALLSSIVDVAGLADGRTDRVFSVELDPIGLSWGMVDVQFWGRGCTEMRSHRTVWSASGWENPWFIQIPASARWMTVTSSQDNVNIVWTLK